MLAGAPREAWMTLTMTMTVARGLQDPLEMAADMKVAAAVAGMKVGMKTEGTRPRRVRPRETTTIIGILAHPEVASVSTATNGAILQDLGEDLRGHQVVHQALPAPATNHRIHP